MLLYTGMLGSPNFTRSVLIQISVPARHHVHPCCSHRHRRVSLRSLLRTWLTSTAADRHIALRCLVLLLSRNGVSQYSISAATANVVLSVGRHA